MPEKPQSIGREILFDVVDGYIGLARLNRPEKRNAINEGIALGLDWIVKETEANPAIRVVILSSTSAESFSAGADLAEISQGRWHTQSTKDGGFAGFVHARRAKPWIAAVQAHALAGGLELALACDLIVASETSRFGLPEVKRGLFAAAGGAFRLVRRLPPAIAYELLATGDAIDARRAHALGLVNRLTTSDHVLDEALALARKISANAPLSVRESLHVARLSNDHSEEELWEITSRASALIFASDDAREGSLAFLEKRAPVWKGH